MIPAALALALTSTPTLTSTPGDWRNDTETEIVIEDIPAESEPPAVVVPISSLRARANVRFDARSSIDLAFDQADEQVTTFGIGGRLELEVDVADWLTAFAAPALFFHAAISKEGDPRYALFLNTPEGWVRAAFGPIDLRIGTLVFNWGTSDLIAPNDVLNPIDYRRNIVASADDTKIPVLAAEVVVRGGPFTLRAVLQPIFAAARYFIVGWDSALIAAPLAERLNLPPQVIDEIEDAFDRARPSLAARDMIAAARAELRLGDLDLAINGVYGWDPLPQLTLAPLVVASYVRRELLGFEATLLIDPVILRFDTAFTFGRSLYTQTLQPVRHPWLNAVLGGEYAYGDDFRIVLELFVIAIFDAQDRLLLFEELSSDLASERTVTLPGAAAFLRYALLGGDLRFELGALTTPTRGDVVLLPAIRYRFFDQHDLTIGATIIQGKDDSYGGAYDHNDELFLQYQWER